MATATKKKMCPEQKKTCYPTRTAAIRAALSYSRKRGTPLRPYWHHQCKSWHLSKNPKW
jgi:hypothetical protein